MPISSGSVAVDILGQVPSSLMEDSSNFPPFETDWELGANQNWFRFSLPEASKAPLAGEAFARTLKSPESSQDLMSRWARPIVESVLGYFDSLHVGVLVLQALCCHILSLAPRPHSLSGSTAAHEVVSTCQHGSKQ